VDGDGNGRACRCVGPRHEPIDHQRVVERPLEPGPDRCARRAQPPSRTHAPWPVCPGAELDALTIYNLFECERGFCLLKGIAEGTYNSKHAEAAKLYYS